MCGFNYRRVPAVALMRQLVAAGRIGTIRHVRAVYLQDWIVDPQFPLVWRLRKDMAGSGALGDIGAHIVDLTQFVTGQSITGGQRPDRDVRPGAAAAGRVDRPGGGRRRRPAPAQVTVDDAALFLARLDGGAVATYEATRFATGRKNGLRVELNGSLGSVVFDFERMNELEFYDATPPVHASRASARILVTEPDHPYMAAWWPPGHPIGYEHSFTHEVRDLIEAIAHGRGPDAVVRRRAAGAARPRRGGTLRGVGSAWVEVEPAGRLTDLSRPPPYAARDDAVAPRVGLASPAGRLSGSDRPGSRPAAGPVSRTASVPHARVACVRFGVSEFCIVRLARSSGSVWSAGTVHRYAASAGHRGRRASGEPIRATFSGSCSARSRRRTAAYAADPAGG